MVKNYKQLLKEIKLIILDVDGVLTDGSIIVAGDGEQMRTMHVRDGYAIHHACKRNFRIVILSGGKSEVLEARFEYLGVKEVFLGISNKYECYTNFIKENSLKPSEILYMGDDIPDYKVMKEVGVACCPSDAAEEIKSICHYISPIAGGKGCVRDIIEQIMKVQGNWFDSESFNW